MSGDATTADWATKLAAIRARASAATGGPWYWKGWTTSHSVYLCSGISMRPVVLDFGRWGMNSARPIFRDAKRDVLIKPPFIGRRGHDDDKEIVGIDHPDAAFIAHSRADVDALLAAVDRLAASEATLRVALIEERAERLHLRDGMIRDGRDAPPWGCADRATAARYREDALASLFPDDPAVPAIRARQRADMEALAAELAAWRETGVPPS